MITVFPVEKKKINKQLRYNAIQATLLGNKNILLRCSIHKLIHSRRSKPEPILEGRRQVGSTRNGILDYPRKKASHERSNRDLSGESWPKTRPLSLFCVRGTGRHAAAYFGASYTTIFHDRTAASSSSSPRVSTSRIHTLDTLHIRHTCTHTYQEKYSQAT